MQTKTRLEVYLTLERMVVITKSNNNKFWRDRRGKTPTYITDVNVNSNKSVEISTEIP